uniref:Uncharacterized protein n=1 Tax=Anguilla anguilla TaxID=7936 RepID=A0A0E9X7C4_ANGAN
MQTMLYFHFCKSGYLTEPIVWVTVEWGNVCCSAGEGMFCDLATSVNTHNRPLWQGVINTPYISANGLNDFQRHYLIKG